jgi:hypothetical protein
MRVIEIAKIKEAVNLLLDHVIAMGVDTVELAEPLYWKILDDDKYAMAKSPTILGIGHLASDLDLVEGVLTNRHEPVALTLTEAAPILAYIGEVVGQQLAASGR